ncbi:N-acetylmuramoyl-L-alanine amidase [Shimia sediminis]|uniref:N-acetylmuramoyl-L-alanine amidase n=1 Tax=Shimia sediminis TaxID=2497945 RepID=UPI001F474E9D|nr:N-acetylmuramoyl-L-alanine amidase [Shimia sediminis]
MPEICSAPSPSFGERRDGARPELIVLHYTAMESAEAALQRLCDPEVEVSAHYLIAEDGRIWQMVAEDMRAWHAGVGQWRGIEDVNSRSIGIELANTGNHPFPEPQMAALEDLMRAIMRRWDITAEGVIGHSDMAPTRKCDPGPRFDWERLEKQGLARRRGTGSPDRTLRELAQQIGFPADVDDETLLAAVRLRYRPWARGPLEPADLVPLSDT